MTNGENPKKKKRRIVGIVCSLVSLAVLTYIAIMLIMGCDPGFSRILNLFAPGTPVEMAGEYHFDVGRNRVFSDLGDSIAAVGTLGVQVLDIGGSETLRDSFRMSSPAIKSSNGQAIAFDIGATSVRVFNEAQIVSSIETGGPIVSASINRNGWFCVCTQEGGGLRGVVTVYNNSGSAVYKAYMASGYVLSAALSDDNKNLAVLNLTNNASRITFYLGLSKESADNEFDLPGELIIDMRYHSSSELIAVTTDSLYIVDISGSGTKIYDFFNRHLGAYTLEDDLVVLHLLDFGIGHRGRLITLFADGTPLGESETDRELISMSYGDGNLAVLRNDGMSFFNRELEEFIPSGDLVSTAGASWILALNGDAALVAGDHFAVVVLK